MKSMKKDKIYGLIGRVLKHSFSVPIHKALGCDSYNLIELEPDALDSFFESENIMGLNVTIPYKREAMKYCDEIDEAARKVGSINTIVRKCVNCEDGLDPDLKSERLVGYNTDVYGLQYAMKRAGIDISGKKVIIFGSGGASLAARAASEIADAREYVVISRSGADNYDNLDRHADADVLINATPVGMYPQTGIMPADPAVFKQCVGVVDMIYNPARTAFVQRAEELGIPCTDGLPMLVAQAVRAEEIFFDRKISDDTVERIINEIRNDTLNIVLIGMPGSGKSTIGIELADMTGRKLVDLDEEIVAASERTIEEIFAESGEDEFRRIEHEVAEQFGKESGLIISCGGGIIKNFKNYAPLHQNGRIYHIERDTALLSRDGRPLSKGADLEAMYKQRLPMYSLFRDAVISNDKTPKDAAQRILNDFRNAGV